MEKGKPNLKFKDLEVGDIFRCPDMPQWGIMMKSWLRNTKQVIYVSLTGNTWSHLPFDNFDDELNVVKMDEFKIILSWARSAFNK